MSITGTITHFPSPAVPYVDPKKSQESYLTYYKKILDAAVAAQTMPAKAYCQRSWVNQTGLPLNSATNAFIYSCEEAHANYNSFVRYTNKII